MTVSSNIVLDEIEHIKQIDKEYVVHPWAVQADYAPVVVERAQGNYFWEAGGRRYLDFTSQAFYANIGHGQERVIEAIVREIRDMPTIYGRASRPKSALTERILGLLPPSYGRVFYGLNGADATEVALKVARLATGRQNVVAFWRSYHGASLGASSVGGLPAGSVAVGQPVPGTVLVPPPWHYRSPFRGRTQEDTDRLTAEYLRATIEQLGPHTVAAIIGETFIAAGGGIVPGQGFWRLVRDVADEFGIVLIADEVQSAFGRTGNWFGRDYYDYEPDVILLAKGLTSGYLPFSAAVFRSELAKRFVNVPFPHGVTYSGHPVSCAAALATIDVIDQDGLIERAAEMGTRLDTALRELFERHLSIGDLRTIGLFAAVEFVRNRDTREPIGANVAVEGATSGTDVAAQVTAAMRRRGVIVSSSRVNGIIKMAPPLTVEPHEIDTTIAALDEVLTLLDRQIDES